jgi:hypothetical protein
LINTSYCALHLCARAEHMNNTNAHTTIHNPYDIASVGSSTIFRCITLHCNVFHGVPLNFIPLHCMTFHSIAFHCIPLGYIHCITLHDIILHSAIPVPNIKNNNNGAENQKIKYAVCLAFKA